MQASESVPVDGNAMAGSLAEIFAVDVTTIRVTCGQCGATRALAEEAAYVRGPGSVLRCAGCTSVLGRLARTRDTVWLDLRGSAAWQLRAAQ